MITAANFYLNNLARVSKISISEALMEKVQRIVSGKSFEQITGMVTEADAKNQFVALASLYCLATEESQNPGLFDPADGIIYRLGESIARYGERAYPLSEAQIKLVVSKVHPYVKSI